MITVEYKVQAVAQGHKQKTNTADKYCTCRIAHGLPVLIWFRINVTEFIVNMFNTVSLRVGDSKNGATSEP